MSIGAPTNRPAPEASAVSGHEDKILLVLTIVIGAVVGLVVVAFILLTENLGSRLYPATAAPWRRALIPVVGALGTGILLFRYFPDARGSGIPQTKAALFIRNGYISFRTVVGKFSLCSISLASGIALGREGPAVHVGAGVASVLGRRLGLSPTSVKALLPVGASAALAAAFNTPIAAVLFSLEEVMGDLHAPVLGSIVLSSATSWIVLHLMLGDEPLFHVPAYQLVHPAEFGVYAVLGAVGGLVSAGFVKLLLWQRKHFLALPRSRSWLYPTAGGLTVGILGWFVPDVLGVGYGAVGRALNGQLVLSTMALLVGLKLVATATCYASGNAGGIFGPSLFIGAMLGGAVGAAVHGMMPDYTGGVGAYALVGMGVAFAGIVRVPMTSVIMIFEMTRDYSIIVPLMIANLVGFVVSKKLQEEPIYEALQHQDGIHLPAGAGARERLLMVGSGFRQDAQVLSATESIQQAASSVDPTRGWWAVVDEHGLRGMVGMSQLEAALHAGRSNETLATLVPDPGRQERLNSENFPHLHTDHSLDVAMQRIAQSGMSVLPVVSRTDMRELRGTISLQDVLQTYGIGRPAAESVAVSPAATIRSRNLLFRVAAVLAGVALLAAILTYHFNSVRADRAQAFRRAGEEFAAGGHYAEAVQQFRNALSISHSAADRQALGLALVAAGAPSEAVIYLDDVLRADPNNGAANLGMARVYARQGRVDESAEYYRRAANGSWPRDAAEHRLESRLELVDVLSKAGKNSNAQAELLSVVADAPKDLKVRRQLANQLVELGLQKEAIVLFRDIVQRNPVDGEAWAALGEAEFALADYAAAQESFEKAAQLGAGDAVKEHSAIAERILALDPTPRGLNRRARYDRSVQVLQEVLNSVQSCGPGTAQAPEVAEEIRQAQASTGRKRRPSSYVDETDTNLDLAERIWSHRATQCSVMPHDALARVMSKLHRE